MDTLSKIDEFGICIFDNSQVIRSLKYQRGGKSSNFSLTTSRLFLKVMVPVFLPLTQWPDTKVRLTYLNQKIPLPSGMLVYETIADITPDVFEGSTVCSSTMDMSGNSVERWTELKMLTSQIYKFQRLLRSNDNEHFQFQHADNIESMTRLKVNLRLRPNCKEFYKEVKQYQFKETLK